MWFTYHLLNHLFHFILQIISPHDKKITQFINDNLEPWVDSWDTSILEISEKLLIDPLNEIILSYYAIIRSNVNDPETNSNADFLITYTAMHGVGYPYVVEAFRSANFKVRFFFFVINHL